MGHLPRAGDGGSLELLAACAIERGVYTHMHNTNPVLMERSSQRQAVVAPGIEVAYDGLEMEI